MKVLLVLLATLSFMTVADARERRGRGGDGDEGFCKDSIEAAGDAAFRIRAAKASAVKRWQEQVINAHGEQYIDFSRARVLRDHCDPARVGGGTEFYNLKRCVIIARPCRGSGRPARDDDRR